MTTALALVTIAFSVQHEPKLEWATFGNFSARLNEGSGYRLVMDKAIADRPMVWFFSKLEKSGFEDLRRSCKELCLNFEIDEALKKVFIMGPNADAGLTLRDLYEEAILESQRITRTYWNLSADGLETEATNIIEEQRDATPAERARLEFKRMVLVSLKNPDSRSIMLALGSVDAKQLASSLVKDPDQEGIVPIPRSAEQMFRNVYEGPRPDDEYGKVMWDATKPFYDEMKADGGKLVSGCSGSDSGGVSISFWLEGRTKKMLAGSISILAPDWLKAKVDPLIDAVPERFANEEYDTNQIAFWGVAGLNSWQTLAIKNKMNTVAWLEPWHPHKDILNTLTEYSRLVPARMKVTDDGWMVPYSYGSRWKEFYGDWQGIINMTGKVTPSMDRDLLAKYLEGVSDAEFDGMAAIRLARLETEVHTLAQYGRLIRAALRESSKRGAKGFDVAVTELSDSAVGDLSKFWPTLDFPGLTAPLAVKRRGYARLKLEEQQFNDPDYNEVVNVRELKIELSVPLGILDSKGNAKVERLQISYAIKK